MIERTRNSRRIVSRNVRRRHAMSTNEAQSKRRNLGRHRERNDENTREFNDSTGVGRAPGRVSPALNDTPPVSIDFDESDNDNDSLHSIEEYRNQSPVEARIPGNMTDLAQLKILEEHGIDPSVCIAPGITIGQLLTCLIELLVSRLESENVICTPFDRDATVQPGVSDSLGQNVSPNHTFTVRFNIYRVKQVHFAYIRLYLCAERQKLEVGLHAGDILMWCLWPLSCNQF